MIVANVVNVSRRELLKGGAALTLAIYLPHRGAAAEPRGTRHAPFQPNAFVRIGEDGHVTVISKHIEMGQGAYSGLATLVADELDADWADVRVEAAPADAARYANLAFTVAGGPPSQGTGGSSAMANSFFQYRQAGATARAMLVAAAAARWQVPPGEIQVERGVLKHAASARHARFGELVAEASRLEVPSTVHLKDAAQFHYIGHSVARTDALAKSQGSARFTQDVQFPDLLVALVARPPRFGARVKRFDASAAHKVRGVAKVVRFETPASCGVAVLAKNFWTAHRGREALKVEWDESAAETRGSEQILSEYRALALQPGAVAKNVGDVGAALAGAAKVLEATYEVPYLAHAAMEPLNCVAQITPAGCEIWNGVQGQSADQAAVASFLGIAPERVTLNMLYAGGSFGRRFSSACDYVLEAVAIARASGTRQPVKMVWTREDDMRGGFYRPAYVHALKAGIDAKGELIAWQHRVVGQSIMEHGPMAGMVRDGIDPTSVEGATDLPYPIDNLRVELHTTHVGVPALWWRSVGSSHTAFVTECFLDELAHLAGRDPLALRRALLAHEPRHLAVLELAAAKSGWNEPLAAGHARGIAVHKSFGSYVAQVAEVSRSEAGIRLERVTCAVDCGLAINPNVVAMQMESAIAFGLSAALSGAITLKGGAVEQSNFHDYPVLRMNQMPAVEVHIVKSDQAPSGVGEPGVPPIAPALANALRALTGKPVRTLPLSAQGITLI